MSTYLAEWPDGTISVLSAENIVDLFWRLDVEGNPFAAKVCKLPSRFHIGTVINNRRKIVTSNEDSEEDFAMKTGEEMFRHRESELYK